MRLITWIPNSTARHAPASMATYDAAVWRVDVLSSHFRRRSANSAAISTCRSIWPTQYHSLAPPYDVAVYDNTWIRLPAISGVSAIASRFSFIYRVWKNRMMSMASMNSPSTMVYRSSCVFDPGYRGLIHTAMDVRKFDSGCQAAYTPCELIPKNEGQLGAG